LYPHTPASFHKQIWATKRFDAGFKYMLGTRRNANGTSLEAQQLRNNWCAGFCLPTFFLPHHSSPFPHTQPAPESNSGIWSTMLPGVANIILWPRPISEAQKTHWQLNIHHTVAHTPLHAFTVLCQIVSHIRQQGGSRARVGGERGGCSTRTNRESLTVYWSSAGWQRETRNSIWHPSLQCTRHSKVATQTSNTRKKQANPWGKAQWTSVVCRFLPTGTFETNSRQSLRQPRKSRGPRRGSFIVMQFTKLLVPICVSHSFRSPSICTALSCTSMVTQHSS